MSRVEPLDGDFDTQFSVIVGDVILETSGDLDQNDQKQFLKRDRGSLVYFKKIGKFRLLVFNTVAWIRTPDL